MSENAQATSVAGAPAARNGGTGAAKRSGKGGRGLTVGIGVGAVLTVVGIALWGIGMGAQESILKAAVTNMVPKASRATGYGIFECSFGVFWFLGSWLLGVLYDISIPAMIAVSVAAQLAAIPLYIRSAKWSRAAESGT